MNFYPLLHTVSVLLCALVSLCYAYQIVYLFLPLLLREQPRPIQRHGGRYAVLIAARNEEAVLPHLLDSLAAQDYPRDKLSVFVVADNCTDATARLAREHGATVYERFDHAHVGKGYALHFLLTQMEAEGGLDRFDAFLVFDADNLLQSDYVRRIHHRYMEGFDAFCGYRGSKNFADNWLSAGYSLWYLHDSIHLNLSRMLLGTSCAVNGTGFGFSRELLERMGGWQFFTLTEDIEFDAWCAVNGVRIAFCREAVLYDEQPTSFRQSWRQRTRWIQGGVQVSLKYAARLFRGLFRGGRRAYTCFETATLSLWGYGVSALATALAFVCVCVSESWLGALQWLGGSLGSMYLALLGVGVLTILSERRRIRATRRQLLVAAVSFPVFMMSYVPIALTALFRPFCWHPIHHTVAVGIGEMAK